MALNIISLLLLIFSICYSLPINNKEFNLRRNILENPNLFDGDILIDKKQYRFGIKSKSRLWSNETIPYVYEDNLPDQMKRVIKEAMKYISSKTCIKFKQRSNELHFVQFAYGNGCTSFVGRIGRAGQRISMGNGCDTLGIATHEIMHAIGFYHHQNRPDRDDYIEIKWENVDSKYKTIFKKLSSKEALVFTPFDFQSLMMYTSNAYSKNFYLKTIVSKVAGVEVSEKGKERMTDWDIYSINKLYDCI